MGSPMIGLNGYNNVGAGVIGAMTMNAVSVLRELMLQPGNEVCADCDKPKPLWVSLDLGILICDQCANIHRRVIESSQLIQVSRDTSTQQVQKITGVILAQGNKAVKEEYEELVPSCYWRPNSFDPLVLHEQWILDKYVRKTFKSNHHTTISVRSSAPNFKNVVVTTTSPILLSPFMTSLSPLSSSPLSSPWPTTPVHADHSLTASDMAFPASVYHADHKEGYMWKRGKDKETFKRRLFILDRAENTLRYYNQENNICEPKGTYRLDNLNVVVAPQTVSHPNGMQITYDVDDTRRNIFVYTATGKELVEWLACIRWLKFKHLPSACRHRSADEVSDMLTHYFLKEGWMHKTGPNRSDSFRKRWFTLDRMKLFYSKGPLEALPQSIVLGPRRSGYGVLDEAPAGYRQPPSKSTAAFTLVTPCRKYVLSAESGAERSEWMRWLNIVIDGASADDHRSSRRQMVSD